jgi:mRNA interferase MazF
MVKKYIPEKGDIIKFNFDPTLGREQAGYRPALIITPQSFNRATQMALVCPITSKIKGFNFEVVLPQELQTQGAVLVFQFKTIDWQERQVKYVESLPLDVMEEVAAKIHALID